MLNGDRDKENSKFEYRNSKQIRMIKIDEPVKSRKQPFFVIPAKAGIQSFQQLTKILDPVFQRGDDFLR